MKTRGRWLGRPNWVGQSSRTRGRSPAWSRRAPRRSWAGEPRKPSRSPGTNRSGGASRSTSSRCRKAGCADRPTRHACPCGRTAGRADSSARCRRRGPGTPPADPGDLPGQGRRTVVELVDGVGRRADVIGATTSPREPRAYRQPPRPENSSSARSGVTGSAPLRKNRADRALPHPTVPSPGRPSRSLSKARPQNASKGETQTSPTCVFPLVRVAKRPIGANRDGRRQACT